MRACWKVHCRRNSGRPEHFSGDSVTLAFGVVLFLSATISFGLLLWLRPLLARYALANPNARSSHKIPTPQGGGIAVIAATVTVVAAAEFLFLHQVDEPLRPRRSPWRQ